MAAVHGLLMFVSMLAVSGAAHGFSVYPADGYSVGDYEGLRSALKRQSQYGGEFCIAHGAHGVRSLLGVLKDREECTEGVVYLGATPTEEQMRIVGDTRLLVVAGTLDGVSRFSRFAVARHRYASVLRRFAVVHGASHHSFTSAAKEKRHRHDLLPAADATMVHSKAASIIVDFVEGGQSSGALHTSEVSAEKLAGPIVKALQLEGSGALGTDVCNSDFPTNPSCKPYPKYPDFSLPPGPVPAPSPLPSSDCVCGSDWVTNYAFPVVSGSEQIGFKVDAADAFHSVSDTHPFHLPHIWNSCKDYRGCTLNVTTLTENFPGSGSLFPANGTGAPLSALELRTKMKSRTTLYKAAGLSPPPSVDKNMSICRKANELAWSWALANAEESVRQRFEKSGEKFVMVDDKEAPIGFKGPEWIKKQLVYTRVNETGTTYISVQSWTFVVGDIPIKSKYIPSGMHYCKLLSPARAMEWIYTDSMRHASEAASA